jgi:hypothetical protein
MQIKKSEQSKRDSLSCGHSLVMLRFSIHYKLNLRISNDYVKASELIVENVHTLLIYYLIFNLSLLSRTRQ